MIPQGFFLQKGHHPSEVIMLPKVGKPVNELTSYRPISLLLFASKVFEKLVLKRIKTVLPQSFLPDHQFSFRTIHSTIDQVHRIVSTIQSTFENKQFCSATFWDVAQAFDRVWHTGLFVKLFRLLPCNYSQPLCDYLANRKFFVVHGDERSTHYDISAGVPQGSVLRPFLYTLFTADAPDPPEGVIAATFAHDTAFLCSSPEYGDSVTRLQTTTIDAFIKWALDWKVVFNNTKSAHVDFALRPHSLYTTTLTEWNSAIFVIRSLPQSSPGWAPYV